MASLRELHGNQTTSMANHQTPKLKRPAPTEVPEKISLPIKQEICDTKPINDFDHGTCPKKARKFSTSNTQRSASAPTPSVWLAEHKEAKKLTQQVIFIKSYFRHVLSTPSSPETRNF